MSVSVRARVQRRVRELGKVGDGRNPRLRARKVWWQQQQAGEDYLYFRSFVLPGTFVPCARVICVCDPGVWSSCVPRTLYEMCN